jgi:alkylation response protein AidB-like acyl-CoA dehydrogenase
MFFQEPPRLENQLDSDPLLREYLERTLPEPLLKASRDELHHLGELSGGELYQLQLADRLNEPRLTQWDAWGHRVDRIELTPLWARAKELACQHGLVAIAYERKHGELSRVLQFAHVYLVDASLDVYSCPLAMTDGAARTLIAHGNQPLIDRAVPRLTSRDPQIAWTSGQWMTERTGGSDVGLSETVARPAEGGQFTLHGVKWFTSAITSEMALTLGRPEGNSAGGRGLALFYVEVRRPDGTLNGIAVNRLKDKLGTRKVPTAELTLDGALATPVAGLGNGVRNISPMLNVTRTWNAVGAIAGMRRAVALARDYARRRVAFGAPLADKPLHADTLAGIEAELEGAFLLAFRAVELLGRSESGFAGPGDERLQRLLTPIVKLTTGKQVVQVVSEALECCGGAGYVEDTGLPRLLRDAQVLPIWEGTTNVLSLDALRALGGEGALDALTDEVDRLLRPVRSPALAAPAQAVRAAIEHARGWLASALHSPPLVESGARRFALTVGRAVELALLCHHAEWCLGHGKGLRAEAAARRFAAHGVDLIVPYGASGIDPQDAALLAKLE